MSADLDIARSLHCVRSAVRAGKVDEALRLLDQSWRFHDNQAAMLAPIYGGLLMLEARDHDAALRLLQRAIEMTPDADVAALIALASSRLGRADDARHQISASLQGYCVLPAGMLSQIAATIMAQWGAPGWIGRGPDLGLVGELSADESSNVLDIRLDGKSAFTQLLRPAAREGRRAFSFTSSQLIPTATLDVGIRGVPLLGSGGRISADFALDGRVAGTARRLTGWVRLGWRPEAKLRLRIEDDKGHRSSVRTDRVASPGWRWPFAINLQALGLRGNRFQVSAQLPDGRWQALPDSPLLLEPALRAGAPPQARLSAWRPNRMRQRPRAALNQNARRTDVIIPVYRGRDESLACIAAVLATIDRSARLIVVDDATEDRELAAALDVLAAERRITLLRHAENQGFVASVNAAMALDPTHDVVLLNADTQVFDDWLLRLRAAAYSGASVGTVTPLTNDGSIASYPRPHGAAMDPEDGAGLHALASATHSGRRLPIPVGVGFCLYIRRDCLDAVGSFDAAVFGKGYGEETDFCLRASRRGWSHTLAADVFVYHAGAVSFGPRRAALLDRSQRLINLRHPGYNRFIADFLKQDPVRALRRQLDERRLYAFDGRFVLLVTLKRAGGVDRYVGERCRRAREQGLHPLVLRPAKAGDSSRCELWTDALDVPNLVYDIPADLRALTAVLSGLTLETIEIHHFLDLDARVIDAVRALPVPYDVLVHDYAWICPRVTLIDGSGRYCGEPAVTVCRSCVRRNGSHLGEAIPVPALRSRSAAWLAGARQVIAPSADTAARLRRHFPTLEVQLQPHTAVGLPSAPPHPNPQREQRVPSKIASKVTTRVALIGAIGEHKGYRLLLACARDAKARGLPLEFVVIGYTEDDAALLRTGRVFITGRYTEGEAAHLLRREHPDAIWLPSVWPETWSYTLDYALASGLPVAAFDLGAIAERLLKHPNSDRMPLQLPPRQINDRLLQLVEGSQRDSAPASRSDQTPLARPVDDVKIRLPSTTENTMKRPATGKSAEEVQEEAMSASVQLLPLPSGLYLFSVKSATPVTAAVTAPLAAKAPGQLSLPAVHVGLGPGVRAEQVEFIAGPSTHGAWLFAQGDLLVTRINGSGATLIMTSVRAPGGEVLAIKVERLESRADAAASSAAALPARSAEPPPAVSPPTLHPPTKKHPVKSPAAASTQTQARVPAPDLPLPLQIQAHIRSRGDMSFADVPWAGRVAPGLWIESFAVRPLQRFGAQDIEYKGLTGSGFETPWLSDDRMCGTRGMAVPLVGFAVRLKPSSATAAYDCEYSGYFQSGVTIGPLRNGAPCRSTVANDPLEAVQIRLVPRSGTATQSLAPKPALGPRSAAKPLARPAKRRAGAHSHKANGTHKGRARKSNGAHTQAAAKRKRVPRALAKHAPRRARPHAHLNRRRTARSTRRISQRRP
jgi:GT2 family glycosyltransferase